VLRTPQSLIISLSASGGFYNDPAFSGPRHRNDRSGFQLAIPYLIPPCETRERSWGFHANFAATWRRFAADGLQVSSACRARMGTTNRLLLQAIMGRAKALTFVLRAPFRAHPPTGGAALPVLVPCRQSSNRSAPRSPGPRDASQSGSAGPCQPGREREAPSDPRSCRRKSPRLSSS
jgi:hypothetical protein